MRPRWYSTATAAAVSVFETLPGAESRERSHRHAAVHIRESEGFGPGDVAVASDGDRQARQILRHKQRAGEAPCLLDGTRVRPGVRIRHRRRHCRGIGVDRVEAGDVVESRSTDDQDDNGKNRPTATSTRLR